MELQEKSKLDFEPNLLVTADDGAGNDCEPCIVAKQLYADEIRSGKITIMDIEQAVELLGFMECIEEIGYAGVPVLARVENGKVCKCVMGY